MAAHRGYTSVTPPQSFAVTWDYRCPFARIGHEHVLDALEAGAPWDVTFVPFFLNQSHVPEGGVPAWDDPAQQSDLVALAAGVVVRDRFPEHFATVHRALFAARHADGGDLRDRAVVRRALDQAGVDADAVLAEVDSGWPAKQVRSEHEDVVSRLDVFGVPTFIVEDQAVFVRLMARPEGDAVKARDTVERVLGLITEHPDLNEFKHTRLTG
jgi:hypothetical protein